MALLILWEVDHQREFPRGGGDGATAALVGFSRRLKAQVQHDAELQQWLVFRNMQKPLARGLPATHHARWSVQVMRPAASEPQGWYEEFLRRWRVFLGVPPSADEATPIVSASSSSASVVVESSAVVDPAVLGSNPGLSRRRPAKPRPRSAAAPQPPPPPSPAVVQTQVESAATASPSSVATPAPPAAKRRARRRPRDMDDTSNGRAARRRRSPPVPQVAALIDPNDMAPAAGRQPATSLQPARRLPPARRLQPASHLLNLRGRWALPYLPP